YTRYGFRDLLAGGCVDIAQPDLGVCGGISEFQKIVTIASVHGVTVLPHVWGSGVALAAALQVLAAMPNTPYTASPVALQNAPVVEFDCNPNPLRDELVEEEFTLDAGCIHIPQDPGLGIHVREEILEKYRTPISA
ncbi:MAG: hypothetical protein KAU31_13995, partial [Spirochaetaceae bacterium]|nr:hypothetical protein [Spirochaetaceae bacterium]